jgi:hypothetical protein
MHEVLLLFSRAARTSGEGCGLAFSGVAASTVVKANCRQGQQHFLAVSATSGQHAITSAQDVLQLILNTSAAEVMSCKH